jgi:helix-turn-helix protein
MGNALSRHMWMLFEPIHALTYFTPESRAAYEAVGLRGYWRGYFAGRAAPLGLVDAAPVIATFYNFKPAMVARAIPSVWSLATPAQTIAARAAGVDAALTRLMVDIPPEVVAEATAIAEKAVELLEPAGRTLGAANAALPIDPEASMLARLWQTTATLREHRGDGHVAALLAYGFGGIEAAIWRTERGKDEEMQGFRGWTPEQWDAGVARLTERGWLDGAAGGRTDAGDAAYSAVEAATDRAADEVWTDLGTDATERLDALLTPIAHAAYAALPKDNPIKLPNPAKA